MPDAAPVPRADWRPATSGNRLSWDGEAVVKSFGGRVGAFARECALLERFGADAEALPAPRMLPLRMFGELRCTYLDGITGTAAIEAGLASQVLATMGAFLRVLHSVNATAWTDVLPGEGPTLVHGDFAHYNVIVSPEAGALVGVLDWEEARRERPALDLAWCEAQFLARYPHCRGALRSLFDAYGNAPDSAQREAALERRMAELRRRAAATGEADEASSADVMYRCSFESTDEAAAFVAALSRFLGSPDGQAFRGLECEALAWYDAAPATTARQHVYLTTAARRATVARFHAPRVEAIRISDVSPSCILLYGAGEMPAWGVDEARRKLTDRQD